ncbi:MAG: hypothetical protein Q9223_006076, partial [Gallowayella weberi]
MHFATICTLLSLLATPLAIIAAPAPAALAIPEPHYGGHRHGGPHWFDGEDDDQNEEENEYPGGDLVPGQGGSTNGGGTSSATISRTSATIPRPTSSTDATASNRATTASRVATLTSSTSA